MFLSLQVAEIGGLEVQLRAGSSFGQACCGDTNQPGEAPEPCGSAASGRRRRRKCRRLLRESSSRWMPMRQIIRRSAATVLVALEHDALPQFPSRKSGHRQRSRTPARVPSPMNFSDMSVVPPIAGHDELRRCGPSTFAKVPASSRPISREKPTTSASMIAASRRVDPPTSWSAETITGRPEVPSNGPVSARACGGWTPAGGCKKCGTYVLRGRACRG